MTINHKAQQAWAAIWRHATNRTPQAPQGGQVAEGYDAWPTWEPDADRDAMIRRAFE